jgi:flavin reductase (DIM6/NTAB) family NADH-FMN oxidoreductase RutF
VLESEFRRGDHVVAVGEVLAGEADGEAAPLLFHRGAYTALPPAAAEAPRPRRARETASG